MDSLIEPSSLAGLEPDSIAISNVNLSLGSGAARVHILKDISLRVAAGESVALTGPSGSGKSSLLMVAAGLEQAMSRPRRGRSHRHRHHPPHGRGCRSPASGWDAGWASSSRASTSSRP